jgi:hypothetical protein
MAETFVAVRRGPGSFEQKVCLKRILPAFEADADFVRMFLEEARIAATLRHANIVQVLDFGVVEGSHFMALELVDGVDLRILLRTLWAKDESMTSGLVSYLAYEISNALDYAHRADASGKVQGVVHRDISPSNVLVSAAGEVKLADFGIAKAMDKTQVTRSGNTKGKVPYMAPEYALSAEYDARSDLFSLGVTLYECLAGKRPFDGATDLDTLRRIQEGEHDPLPMLLPTAPRTLVEAVEKLIDPTPAGRFPNAAALQDALVDVAPPPTARRILAELVRSAQRTHRDEVGRKSGDVAYADTHAATPEGAGTMALGSSVGEDGRVVPASSDAETRTAFGGEAGQTIMDADAAEAARVADAETRALEPKPAPAVDTADAPETSRSRAPFIAGGMLLLATLVAVATVAAFSVSDDGETTAEVAAVATSAANTSDSPEATGSGSTQIPTGVEAPPAAETDEGNGNGNGSGNESGNESESGNGNGNGSGSGNGNENGNGSGDAPHRPAMSSRPTGLKIGVLPWGEVFIDGRSRGNAPVEVELRPGFHVVRVEGPPGLENEQRVRVASGRMRELQIRLR